MTMGIVFSALALFAGLVMAVKDPPGMALIAFGVMSLPGVLLVRSALRKRRILEHFEKEA